MRARAAYRVQRFRWRLVQTPGGAFPRCERKSAVCFFYLQGGRIASSQFTSDSPGTAADSDDAGRVVAVVDSRGEPGDPDSGHGNIG